MRRTSKGYWQSYADLAMGVMAVMILVLLAVLLRQSEQAKQIDESRRQFAKEMLLALSQGQALVRGQDAVDEWLAALFSVGGCDLSYDPKTGRLTLGGDPDRPSELYDTGDVGLRREAQEKIENCGAAFSTLAVCLQPGRESLCAARLDALLGPDTVARIQAETATTTRWESVEALVLQGNTDRRRTRARRVVGLPEVADPHLGSFIDNAYLGAERARQAIAHLLASVASQEAFERNPPPRPIYALLSHLAVESPSFGRFQADPERPQASDCLGPDCTPARNLALKVRWRRASLRDPLDQLRRTFCDEARQDGSWVRQALAEQDLEGTLLDVCPGGAR